MELIIQIISIVLPVGVFYGATTQRIKQLEKQLHETKPIVERLASVEAKLDFLINKK